MATFLRSLGFPVLPLGRTMYVPLRDAFLARQHPTASSGVSSKARGPGMEARDDILTDHESLGCGKLRQKTQWKSRRGHKHSSQKRGCESIDTTTKALWELIRSQQRGSGTGDAQRLSSHCVSPPPEGAGRGTHDW